MTGRRRWAQGLEAMTRVMDERAAENAALTIEQSELRAERRGGGAARGGGVTRGLRSLPGGRAARRPGPPPPPSY